MTLPYGSQPFGIVFSPVGIERWSCSTAAGALLALDGTTGAQLGSARRRRRTRVTSPSTALAPTLTSRGSSPRRSPAKRRRSCTTQGAGAEVLVVDPSALTLTRTIVSAAQHQAGLREPGLRRAELSRRRSRSRPTASARSCRRSKTTSSRGTLRSGVQPELPEHGSCDQLAARSRRQRRGPCAAHRPRQRRPGERGGLRSLRRLLFVALETSREVAVVDAHAGDELFRIDTGRAPQGLVLFARRPYVSTSATSWTGPWTSYDLTAAARQRPVDGAAARHAALPSTTRTSRRECAARQTTLLRRPRHAPRARRLHELRVVPQRRRRPTAGRGISPAWARACATRLSCAAPAAAHGRAALELELRRGAGFRGPDSFAGRRHRPDGGRGLQHGHAQPTVG